MYYQIIVFLHVLGSFIFLMAHGGSLLVAFQLKKEGKLERIQALLYLSGSSIAAMYLGLLFLVGGGIWAGFLGHWWGMKWIWVSLALLLTIIIYMYMVVTPSFRNLKKAAGVSYFVRGRPHPAEQPASLEEILALVQRGKPYLDSLIGLGGFLLILYLMYFKPF